MMVGQPVPTTAPPPMVIKGALHGNEMLYTKLQQFILINILTPLYDPAKLRDYNTQFTALSIVDVL